MGNQCRHNWFSVVPTSWIRWTASSDPTSAAQSSYNAADNEQRSSDFYYSGIRIQNFLPKPPRFHFSSQSSWQQLPSPGCKGSCTSMLLCVLFVKGFGVESFSQGFFFFISTSLFFQGWKHKLSHPDAILDLTPLLDLKELRTAAKIQTNK